MFEFLICFGMIVSAYWIMEKTIDFIIRKMCEKGW